MQCQIMPYLYLFILHRTCNIRFYLQAKPTRETDTSNNSQGIVLESLYRGKRCSRYLLGEVLKSMTSEILDFLRMNVVEKSIYGEISTRSVLQGCPKPL